MSWDERPVFVNAMVDRVECKRRKESKDHVWKGSTFNYHLKIDGERMRVCFCFFLSTTGLKETCVRDQLKKQFTEISEKDPREKEAFQEKNQDNQ